MAPQTARQSISEVEPLSQPHQLGVGPVGLPSPRPQTTQQPRASNEARALLVVADVTPTGYRVGVFIANHARYATDADRRRKVSPGEIFCYWSQAKIAAEIGCSVRQVKRGVRSLREAGLITVRQRVRPYGASYVFARPVPSGVTSGGPSGVPSHKEPRTNHKRTPSEPFKRVSARGTRTSVPKSPVKTAAPLKGSPIPSHDAATTEAPASASALRGLRARWQATVDKTTWPPDVILASTDVKASNYLGVMRDLATKHKARPISAPEGEAPSFQLDPDLEARFAEQDRLLHEQKAEPKPPPPTPAVGCSHCGHDRLMGGTCDQCGYDDGSGFSPSPDFNAGH